MWQISCSVLLVVCGTVWLYGTVFWGLLSWSHQSCQPKSDLWTYTTRSKIPAGPWFIILWKNLRVSWKDQPFCGTKAKLWTKCIAQTDCNCASDKSLFKCSEYCRSIFMHSMFSPCSAAALFSDVTSLQVELQRPAVTLWNAEALSRFFHLQMAIFVANWHFRLQKADLAGPFEERDRCNACPELARNPFCLNYSIIFWHQIQNELTQPWSSPSLTLCFSYPAWTHPSQCHPTSFASLESA